MTVSTMHLRTFLVLALLLPVAFGFTASTDRVTAPPEEGFYPIQQMYHLNQLKSDVERVGLIWKEGAPEQEQKLKVLKRAVASIEGQLFVGYVQDKSDIGDKFRLLTREHNVQVLWILENDGVVDASAPRKFLIKNSVEQGIPLLAPSKDWVSAGAPLAIEKVDGNFRLFINEPAAKATALQVPDNYEAETELVASAN